MAEWTRCDTSRNALCEEDGMTGPWKDPMYSWEHSRRRDDVQPHPSTPLPWGFYRDAGGMGLTYSSAPNHRGLWCTSPWVRVNSRVSGEATLTNMEYVAHACTAFPVVLEKLRAVRVLHANLERLARVIPRGQTLTDGIRGLPFRAMAPDPTNSRLSGKCGGILRSDGAAWLIDPASGHASSLDTNLAARELEYVAEACNQHQHLRRTAKAHEELKKRLVALLEEADWSTLQARSDVVDLLRAY